MPPHDKAEAVAYNNQFRYGPRPLQRFISIIFGGGDPWIKPRTRISFLVNHYWDTTHEGSIFKEMKNTKFFCKFLHPAVATTPLTGQQNMFFASCEIPEVVRDALNHSVKAIELDLVSGNSTILLKNIEVKRLHRMDRRSFNVSVTTMTMGIDNPMLVDWMVYHLALGVQHFYVYDNRRWFPSHGLNGNITATHPLKPFLDANLLTLIYHPFLSTDDLW